MVGGTRSWGILGQTVSDKNDWLFDVIWELSDLSYAEGLPEVSAKLEEVLDTYLAERNLVPKKPARRPEKAPRPERAPRTVSIAIPAHLRQARGEPGNSRAERLALLRKAVGGGKR